MSLSRVHLFRLAILLAGCSYAAYSLLVAYDLPFADHWRFLRESLIPFLRGDATLLQYLLSEYRPLSHKHVLTLLHLLMNYHVFDLDYRVECYIGLLSALITFCVLSSNFLRSTRGPITSVDRWFILTLLAFAFLNPMNVVAWSLVQFEYLYLLFVVLLFSALDSSKNTTRWSIPLWIAAAFLYLTCDAANFTAVLAVLLLMTFFGDRVQRRKLPGLIVSFVIVYWIMDAVLAASGLPPKSSNRVAISLDANSPLAALDFFLFAYAQPVLDHAYFREAFGTHWVWAFRGLGAVFLALSSASLWIYGKYRERLTLSSVPALLVLFSAVSALGIFLSRFWEFGAEVALSDRYLRLFDLGLVGSLWIIMVALTVGRRAAGCSMRWRLWMNSAWTTITVVICAGFVLSSVGRWIYLDHIIDKKVHLLHAMYRYAEDEQFPIGSVHPSCGRGLCREPIDFLQEEKLSFFRDEFPRQHRVIVSPAGGR